MKLKKPIHFAVVSHLPVLTVGNPGQGVLQRERLSHAKLA
jgi:hypothetical protein